ncbi:dethiobiotin synthase [Serratia microhaemolytica]|uniref:dethiobiotin synthase n=1 Tax=Serratia microhaemolytica TaxID=2675110 RepID=UPI003B82E920
MIKYFVTGTDTEVGKTVVSCALLQAAAEQGWRCAGYKPVASGCHMTPQGWRNSDALALQRHSSVPLDYQQVNPYRFVEATAPHIASAIERRPIALADLSAGLRQLEQQADWLVIEGAGGWFTPLSAQQTLADWVQQEQLAVILVVGVKLGCINHAMLTALAIRQAGLRLAGWVANTVMAPGGRHQQYLAALCQRLPAPLLGTFPHLAAVEQQRLAHYLDLSRLIY